MRHWIAQLNRVLACLLLCLLTLPLSARAAGPCSLQVNVRDEVDGPVAKVNVELVRVALFVGGEPVLEPAFDQLGLTARELDQDGGARQADRVLQYVHARELTGTSRTTAANGVVTFAGLEQGIYLVLERGDQRVSFSPYLVRLPGRVDGGLQYHLVSYPKTSHTDTRTVTVFKLWDDNGNAAGHRPASIQVTLLRNGQSLRTVRLSQANDWQYTFYQLPNQGEYAVRELAVNRYQVQVETAQEGFVLINTYTGGGGGGGVVPQPQRGHLTVHKVWDDENDKAGKRPASVSVQLVCSGRVAATATLSAANSWSHTFENLDKSKDYTVYEIPVADYTASYSGSTSTGITVTNRYTAGSADPGTPPGPEPPDPQLIRIPVTVLWEDDADRAGKRPEQVTVRLLSEGNVVQTLVLDLSVDWKGLFVELPGDRPYSVWQSPVSDYTTTYSGDSARGFVITNRYTAGTTNPSIPSQPSGPDEPSIPVGPAWPDDPVDPDTPTGPDQPDGPRIPQTGDDLWPAWLLLGGGGGLMLLGMALIRWGRREYE